MTTKYQCKGCGLVFDGIDPFPFGDRGEPLYPHCPNYMDAPLDNSQSLDEIGRVLDQLGEDHEVSLAVVTRAPSPIQKVETPKSVAPPPFSWGNLTIKAETQEERLQREQQDRIDRANRRRDQQEREANTLARQLVQRMERIISQGSDSVSSNFGMDLQYGTKSNGKHETASADTIARAGVMWELKGTDYNYRSPRYKRVWDVRMANFEKLIVSGDSNRGKHNFHVVPT